MQCMARSMRQEYPKSAQKSRRDSKFSEQIIPPKCRFSFPGASPMLRRVTLAIIIGTAIAGSLFAIAPIVPYISGGTVFAIMLIPAFFLMRWAKRQEVKRKNAMPLVVPAGD